ncbi:dTDP-4-dehydrorhamnose reductase [Methylocella sp. CPCC 101449]|uniref:dTDP-4-dehydrorhamnose reductase n=1 Tax=Methylocella sp. CPCC 101449 TaxID=2987531 RepID=UPI0028915E73|nr:dTDP-4-dehydrorhamnose reductase [Methylocella sp. CPCC 101449]MDT2019468.1 dTDP-4-dehydrorhamnose reductase [Methylocella sp. CPCC 101449]
MNSRILLLGAEGQVGREIRALAASRGAWLKGLGHSSCNIIDRETIDAAVAAYRPTLIVNAAAFTAVDRAESEPELAHAVNTMGAGFIAEVAAKRNIPLLHFSTDYVFDGTKYGAYNEGDQVAPLGVYGRSKEEGERRIREVCAHHIILRTAWIFGIHGNNFLKTMLRLAEGHPSLRVVTDQRGSPTATIDLAQATMAVRDEICKGRIQWGTYHFAGQGEATWYEFAQVIMAERASILGSAPQVVPITTSEYPTLASRPVNSVLDSDRFAEVFGLRSKPWQKRVRETVAALVKR